MGRNLHITRALAIAVAGLLVSATGCDSDPKSTSATGDPSSTSGTASQGGGGSSAEGGGGNGANGAGGSGGQVNVAVPRGNEQFDYQLGGTYPPDAGVALVVRDRAAAPAPNLYNVCYVNGFQIQPDEEAFWLSDHPDLILRDTGGNPVIDEDWDEMLLDVSTPEKRAAIATIVGGWITGCANDGFDAVEIDNLDSYARSGGLLEPDHAVEFMKLLSAGAHGAGVAIAQKNSAELLNRKSEMGTDFAIAEECNRYAECEDYINAYADKVFIIEYRKQDFDAGCQDYPVLSIVLRDLLLTTPADGQYVYDAC